MNKKGGWWIFGKKTTTAGADLSVPTLTKPERRKIVLPVMVQIEAEVKEYSKKVIAGFEAEFDKDFSHKESKWRYGFTRRLKDLYETRNHVDRFLGEVYHINTGDNRYMLRPGVVEYELFEDIDGIQLLGGYKEDITRKETRTTGGKSELVMRPDFDVVPRGGTPETKIEQWVKIGEDKHAYEIFVVPAINLKAVKPTFFVLGRTIGTRNFVDGGRAESLRDINFRVNDVLSKLHYG